MGSSAAVLTDVVVAGAGGCGLAAALAAAEGGARVLLLEHDAAAGGTTAMSAGMFVAAESRLQREAGLLGTAGELAENIFHLNGGESPHDLTLALCRASGPLMDWLQGHGVALEPLPGYRYTGMRADWMVATPARRGSELVDPLLAAVARHPAVDLRLATPVRELTERAGTVTGVVAETAGGERLRVRAAAVILATSGFGASGALVARHIPALAGAPYYGAPHADGDAIRWGGPLGAALAHMGAYQTHSSIADPRRMLVTTYLINEGAIQVNRAGRRFGDESDSYAGHALALQAQPGRWVVELFDEQILQRTLAGNPRFADCIEAGILHRAATLPDLAAHFGLDGAELARTVETYNAAVLRGEDAYGRRRFGRPLAPPYCGIRVTSALVQTLGGLRVDGQARVLRPDGTVIPGLYAGGGSAVGLAGARAEGYMAGTGLLAALGLGWIAGREAAREVSGP